MVTAEHPLFISAKIDFAFKEIMQRPQALKSFLSAVLQIPLEDMKTVQMKDTHLPKRFTNDKLSILDVRLTLNDDTEIDIEMQLTPFCYWNNRSLYYNCRQFTDQGEEGDPYSKFKQCIHISVLDFALFAQDQSPDFHSTFHLREDKTSLLYTDMLEFHVLELPKLPENAKDSQDPLLWWGSFINAKDKEELQMLSEKDQGLAEAFKGLNAIQMDRAKREAYLRRQMALMDYNTQMQTAREEGRELGQQEKALDIACKMLGLGLNKEDIAQITGLSLEQIAELAKKP